MPKFLTMPEEGLTGGAGAGTASDAKLEELRVILASIDSDTDRLEAIRLLLSDDTGRLEAIRLLLADPNRVTGQIATAGAPVGPTNRLPVDALGLTEEQLRSAPLLTNPDEAVSGILLAVGDTVVLTASSEHTAWSVQLAGVFSETSQVVFEGTTDGIHWFALNGRLNADPSLNANINSLTAMPWGPGPLHYRGNAAGVFRFRVRLLVHTPGDSINVTIRSGSGTGAVFLNAPLPTGHNFIGYQGGYEDDAARQGRYRWSGGQASTNATSPNASMTITNPAGSGADIILTRYQVEVDASANVVVIYDAVSTGNLRALTNPNRRTEVLCPAEVRIGSGVLTGGTAQDYIRRAGTQAPVAVGPFRHRISPGKSWSVRFLGPGASNSVWFTCGLYVVPEGGDLT